MKVRDNIKRIREAKGVTQISVAKYLGISPMRYHRLENDNKTIDPDFISLIARYLGVSEETFFSQKLTESVANFCFTTESKEASK